MTRGHVVSVPKFGRRGFCAVSLAAAFALLAPSAWAGSYLDRAALLVAQASREADYLRLRLTDSELARTVHKLAAARLKAASTMQVPKEVAQAHPHLLLMLENYERAADAARGGKQERFFEFLTRARDEEGILRGVLKQLGWPLPKA
jgi:recombinational DNA repair ATPase RecF